MKGGKRKGAGRPQKSDVMAKDSTKVVRVSFAIADQLKSGYYQHVMQTIADYQQEIIDNPKSLTSPRYDKLKEFLSKI